MKELICDFFIHTKEGQSVKSKFEAIENEIDFSRVEEKLEFRLHKDLKDFLNSFYFNKIESFILPNQIRPTEKWGSWFEFDGQNKSILIALKGIKSKEINIESYIEKGFNEWTGGYDFGRRFNIGSMYDSRGLMLIVFNNDTGTIEWIDSEWGGFGNLNEDPNGILANSLYELVNLMKTNLYFINE